MDTDSARDFIRENHRGVLATRRSGGGIQQSPIIAAVDDERFPGENPDWDEYRERMERERRVLVRITIERAGPDRQG